MRRFLPRLAILALFAGMVGVVWWAALAWEISSADELIDHVRDPLEALGLLRWPAALALATLLFIALVSSPIVFVACGLLLGTVGGLIVALTGLGLAAIANRRMGRTLFGEWLQARLRPKWPHLDSTITRYGFPGVLAARLVGTPPSLIGWASSATTLRAWQVVLGIVLGTVPRGFAYVSLGASGAALWPPSEWTPLVIVSLVLLVVIGIASLVVTARLRPPAPRDED